MRWRRMPISISRRRPAPWRRSGDDAPAMPPGRVAGSSMSCGRKSSVRGPSAPVRADLDRPLVEEERPSSMRTGSALDLADEGEDEGRGRRVVDLVGRADLLDPPLVHHHDAVGELHRLLLVVGDEDGGVAGPVVDLAQPAAELAPDLGVERAERLVEEEHARLDGERAGERHALPLAAGELRRVALLEAGELHEIEQLQHALADLRRATGAAAPAGPSGRRRCCRTPSCGGRARSSGTRSRRSAAARRGRAHPRRRRGRGRRSGSSRPARMRSSVVLPEPDGPSSASSSPAPTSSETSCSAGVSPNALTTFSTVTSDRRAQRGCRGRCRLDGTG